MAISCDSVSDTTVNHICSKSSEIFASAECVDSNAAQSYDSRPNKSKDDTPRSSWESDSDDSVKALPKLTNGRSTTAYLNYVRECKRRFGAMYHGQTAVNVAAQRWRAMPPERRTLYRRQYTEQDAIASSTVFALDTSDSFEDVQKCGKRSCGKPKRKKSSCAERRRQKSACNKQKHYESCRKPKSSKLMGKKNR